MRTICKNSNNLELVSRINRINSGRLDVSINAVLWSIALVYISLVSLAMCKGNAFGVEVR